MRAATRRGFFKRAIWGGAAAAQLRLASAAHGACPGLRGPVRWIVPNAAGGGYDAFSRLLAPYLERGLGARIHVDNIAGAGGLRGATVLSGAGAGRSHAWNPESARPADDRHDRGLGA